MKVLSLERNPGKTWSHSNTNVAGNTQVEHQGTLGSVRPFQDKAPLVSSGPGACKAGGRDVGRVHGAEASEGGKHTPHGTTSVVVRQKHGEAQQLQVRAFASPQLQPKVDQLVNRQHNPTETNTPDRSQPIFLKGSEQSLR